MAQLVSGWQALAPSAFIEKRGLNSGHPKQHQSIRPASVPEFPHEFGSRRLAGKLRTAFDVLFAKTTAPFTGKAEQ